MRERWPLCRRLLLSPALCAACPADRGPPGAAHLLVALDIGNTRTTVGLFEGADLRAAYTLASDVRRTADEYAVMLAGLLREDQVDCGRVRGAAIASVVPPLTEAFQHLCQRLFGVRALAVDAGVRTGIKVATHNPREVGPDRVVNAVAAHRLYGGPAIIVDFGTPTSFDVVGTDGAYLGSVIAPGLAVSAEALFQATSRLPRVDLLRPKSVVGRDTAGALQSGILLGHVALVEGMVARIQAEVGPSQVIATGELAPLVARETAAINRVEPNLTLMGLRFVYELNAASMTP